MNADDRRPWREFPIFIPYEEHHLSAVLTVPATASRGMVLLMAGYGAPRSHRFQMWARAARRLAEECSLASIRFDYVGFGDSTGLLLKWGWGEDVSAARQATTAARVGLDLLGLDRFIAVANCTGGASSVRLAAEMEECVGAISLLMPVLMAPTNGIQGRLRQTKVAQLIRYNTFFREHVGRPLRDLLHRSDGEMAYKLARAALGHARLLFVYGELDATYSPKVNGVFEKTLQRLPREYRQRFGLTVFPGTHLGEFESVAIQDMTIESVVRWSDSCFDGPRPAEPTLDEAGIA